MDATPDPRQDLLEEHVDGVRRLARHLVRDPDDAEDVAQESLLVAVDRRPEDVRDVAAWLRGVVRNKARMFGRRAGRRTRHEGRVPAPGLGKAADDMAAGLEVQQRLVEAVRSLPESYRTVLWLRYFEDLSAREIAERLTMPVETVRTRVKRGRAQLRTGMDERHDGKRATWVAALAPLLPEGAATISATVGPSLLTPTAVIGTLALVAALVFGLVALVDSRSEPSPVAEGRGAIERVADAGGDQGSTPVELRGTPRREPAADAPSRPAGGARGVFIQGRVSSQDGKAIPGALVSIVEGEGLDPPGVRSRPWRLLGKATTDELGRYRVDLDPSVQQRWPRSEGERVTTALPGLVLAMAEARGFRRGRQRVPVKGQRTTFDFHLGPGRRLEGQVRDAVGRPVADLPLRVATMQYVPHMVSTSMFWTQRKRLSTVSGNYAEHVARTDADGRFVVAGLEPGRTYAVLSTDFAWFLKQDALVRVEADEDPVPITLLAVRGRAVRGRVIDATTREPLPRGLVDLMLHAPDSDSMGSNAAVQDGRFLAGWDLDDELQGLLEVTATAEATGYKTATVTGTMEADASVLEFEIALEPILEDDGTVLMTASDLRGAPLLGELFVTLRGSDDARIQLRRRPEHVRDGVYRFDVPAGSYVGTVEPRHVLGSYCAGAFEVRVVADAVTQVRVEAGGGATLRLRLPLVDEMPSSMLSLDAVGERDHHVAGGSTDLSLDEDQILRGEDLVWAGFLPGTWKIELHWDGEILERTVTLAEGDDHLVSFR